LTAPFERTCSSGSTVGSSWVSPADNLAMTFSKNLHSHCLRWSRPGDSRRLVDHDALGRAASRTPGGSTGAETAGRPSVSALVARIQAAAPVGPRQLSLS
jgi:hypothetical protein